MKTTLQELIQEMEELKRTKLYPESFKAIDECIYLAWAKLEMEKEQIGYSEEDVRQAQQAILGNIKDALMNKDYIIEYLNQNKNTN